MTVLEIIAVVVGMLVSIGTFLTPIVLAARSRDQTLVGMISNARETTAELIDAEVKPLHERINRVRDEYVRRDDLANELRRIDKTMDELKKDFRGGIEEVKAILRERKNG